LPSLRSTPAPSESVGVKPSATHRVTPRSLFETNRCLWPSRPLRSEESPAPDPQGPAGEGSNQATQLSHHPPRRNAQTRMTSSENPLVEIRQKGRDAGRNHGDLAPDAQRDKIARCIAGISASGANRAYWLGYAETAWQIARDVAFAPIDTIYGQMPFVEGHTRKTFRFISSYQGQTDYHPLKPTKVSVCISFRWGRCPWRWSWLTPEQRYWNSRTQPCGQDRYLGNKNRKKVLTHATRHTSFEALQEAHWVASFSKLHWRNLATQLPLLLTKPASSAKSPKPKRPTPPSSSPPASA